MRNVICVWNNGNGAFEKNIPLEYIARRNERLGYSSEIDVIVMGGFNFFSSEYKETLLRLKFRLIDCTKLYSEAEAMNLNLARFGDYELKCFLRWIVLYKHYVSEPLIHYDGDVVFNENPDFMATLLKDKTFVLQGCPAFTCIGDPVSWHEAYGAALNEFTANIDSYSKDAWVKREGWEKSEKEKWAGQRYRKTISSDQDFISHLIHTDQIKQDSPQSIMDILPEYMMFENPLFINGYSPWNYTNCTYRRIDSVDYINDKRVFFWHMQSHFSNYLSRYLIMSRLLRCTNQTVTYETDGTHDLKNRIAVMLEKVMAYSRFDVYRFFFDETDFSPVFRNVIWWKAGVFA